MSEVRRYDAPRKIASPGIGPLSLVPSAMLFATFLATVLMFMVGGMAAGTVTGFLGVVAITPAVVKRGGRPLYGWALNGLRRRGAERAGSTIYRSGLLGVTPDGSTRLPGVLAALECYSVDSDGLGRPFALLQLPQQRLWSVVLRVMPEGGALVDAETRDLRVSGWGQLLAAAGQFGQGAALVTAVIETLPDTGALLRAHVESMIAPDAPPFAANVLRAAGTELPFGVASTIGYVSITFTEMSLLGSDGKRSAEERTQEATAALGRLLPDLTVQLMHAGASSAVPLEPYALTQRIKEAYDPDWILPHADMTAEGQPPRIIWEDCGPSAHDDLRDRYLTDSGAHVVFEASRMPRGAVTDRVLEALASPSPDAPRRRVTLLYRPVPADRAAAIADAGVKASLNRFQRRKGPAHAHDAAGLTAAMQTANEEATGAGITDVAMLVTVTANRNAGEDIDRAAAAIKRVSTSTFRLQLIHGAQAAGFAVGLGLGITPWQMSMVPASLRDNL